MNQPSAKDVRDMIVSYISYCPETGIFRWIKSINANNIAGNIAGVNHSQGYIQIGIKNKIYLAHRLAWLITFGVWPDYIDHINGIKNDNRLCNLRNVTSRQNCQNTKKHRDGKLVGAIYDKNERCWKSAIKIKNISIHLGYFDNEIDAHNAYKDYLEKNSLGNLISDYQGNERNYDGR